jgi:hypothetical protein
MVAAALIDRLVRQATMITLKGKSYRLRERASTSCSLLRLRRSATPPERRKPDNQSASATRSQALRKPPTAPNFVRSVPNPREGSSGARFPPETGAQFDAP